MKKRIVWLACISLLCVMVLSGCRCEPSKVTWLVQSFQKEEVFANGREILTLHTGTPSVRDPFGGMETEMVTIDFSKDGKVSFRPGTGEVLTGTYTYSHKGTRYTNVTVTLDNGESFTCKASTNSYYSTLTFTFRDKDYMFQDTGSTPDAYYQNNLVELCKAIRYWATDSRGDIPIQPCTITVLEAKIIMSAHDQNQDFILDETMAVRCYRLDGENQLHSMESIVTGECFYSVDSLGDITLVTLYYVDPVAENG